MGSSTPNVLRHNTFIRIVFLCFFFTMGKVDSAAKFVVVVDSPLKRNGCFM